MKRFLIGTAIRVLTMAQKKVNKMAMKNPDNKMYREAQEEIGKALVGLTRINRR